MTVYDNIVRMWYIWYFTCIVNGNLFLLGAYFWSIFWISSVAQLCPILCNPKDCSTPGLPVHHQLTELPQTHDQWVGDAIQTSHPLSSLLPLPSIFPSIRVFSSELEFHILWPCLFWNENWPFSVLWPLLSFLNLLAYRVQHFNSIIF